MTTLPSPSEIEEIDSHINGTYVQEKLNLFKGIYSIAGDFFEHMALT